MVSNTFKVVQDFVHPQYQTVDDRPFHHSNLMLKEQPGIREGARKWFSQKDRYGLKGLKKEEQAEDWKSKSKNLPVLKELTSFLANNIPVHTIPCSSFTISEGIRNINILEKGDTMGLLLNIVTLTTHCWTIVGTLVLAQTKHLPQKGTLQQ